MLIFRPLSGACKKGSIFAVYCSGLRKLSSMTLLQDLFSVGFPLLPRLQLRSIIFAILFTDNDYRLQFLQVQVSTGMHEVLA
jgi:hypothetical protein